MSLYLNTDSGEQLELAANAGWSDMGKWIDSLDAGTFSDLVHLWEQGWSEPVSALAAQIQRALQSNPPEANVQKTATELLQSLSTLAPDGAVVVTNGMGDDTEDTFSAWDESQHKRDHGKFAPKEGTESTTAEPKENDTPASPSIATPSPGLVSKAKAFVTRKYEKLASRYGPKGAIAILSAMVLLSPVPVPGTSLIPIALAEGVRALGGMLGGKQMSEEAAQSLEALAAEAGLGVEELKILAQEALREAEEEVNEE
jgi:hypothetical protein